ncbi:nuclear transport factor 2 family protein [Ideonella azotifigens]|uniref:Nuclear transport factor 2 family protein n=1 Tax=Ideonella azotifigens TaxID=513160 RepID=A0ABN1K1Y7_9BURK|nr:nuclear transport factor 2 family protein [Ideonella azotifigens]MCD2341816.1 nuclear transport factor 2 family protein [Ideonella azotifigens]
MSLDLPKPITDYFSSDRVDPDAAVQCFTDNAVVKDEGRTYMGSAAIKEWKGGSSKKYTYTIEPLAAEEVAGKTVVTGHVTGNFPGSPVDLRFSFGLDGAKIASLEITL